MKHDPKCRWKDLPPQHYEDGSIAECGMCDLIRAVREDAAARNYNTGYNDGYAAAQRDAAEAVLNHRMRGYLCSCGVEVNSINGHLWNVIDALRGDR